MTLPRRRVLTFAALAFTPGALRAHGGVYVGIGPTGFTPRLAELHVGEAVVFFNEDTAPHRIVADNRVFDTGKIMPGDLATVVIDAYGSVFYHCALVPRLKGNIVAR